MKDKFSHFSKKFIKHELITGSFFMFAGSMLSSFFSFVLNLFFARSLTAADYGIYASLLSLFTLIALIPSQSISTVIVKFATSYLSQNKISQAVNFYKKTFKSLLVFSLLFFILFLFLSIPIGQFLKIDNIYYIVLIGFAVCINYLYVPNSAFTQSLLKFSFISLSLIVSAAVRLISGVVLILLGFKVFGALFAILLSVLVSLLILFIPIRSILKIKGEKVFSASIREIIKYALPTCISILALTSLMTMDVILVKHFFNPSQAGFYGGLSLIGRVIFYFTGTIPLVMFPLVVKRKAKGENIASLFYLAIFLVTIPSVIITCFYYLFPAFSINFFLGKSYLGLVPYLGIFGVFITIYCILNVCVNFFLSIGKTRVFIPVVVAMISQIVFISLFHSSLFQVIGVSLVISILLLVYLLASFAKEYINIKSIRSYLATPSTPGL